MERIRKFKDSNTFTCLSLTKTLANNITTFIALFYSIGLIPIDNTENTNSTNVTIVNTNSHNNTSIEDNSNISHFSYMMILCTFFGLIRIINDFINLCKYGKDIPDNASRGDYIGVFGEDLAVLCIEVAKRVLFLI